MMLLHDKMVMEMQIITKDNSRKELTKDFKSSDNVLLVQDSVEKKNKNQELCRASRDTNLAHRRLRDIWEEIKTQSSPTMGVTGFVLEEEPSSNDEGEKIRQIN